MIVKAKQTLQPINVNYNDQIEVDVHVKNTGIQGMTLSVRAVVGIYDPNSPQYNTGLPITFVNSNNDFLAADEESNFSVIARVLPNSGIDLFTGLNYCLYNGVTGPIRTVLTSLLNVLIAVWYYDSAASAWKSFNPNAPDWANDLTQMTQGEKYWINVSANTLLPTITTINSEAYPPGTYDLICLVINPVNGSVIGKSVLIGAVTLLAPPSLS